MNKEELKKLLENPKYIHGIHNFCDRWCDRCSFASRCLNYEFSEKQFNNSKEQDINNIEFWNKLSEVFVITLELLEDEAKEFGIDLSKIDTEEIKQNLEVSDKEVDQNSSVIQAQEYIKMVDDWFKLSENYFVEKKIQLEIEEKTDLPNSSPLDTALTITDSIEIVRWYQLQIFVKLKRAVVGKIEELEEKSIYEIQNDSNGSAKVALIGIDNSIAAWGKLLNNFTEQEDQILKILLHLIRLKNTTEYNFPRARRFMRIGFDKI